MSENDLIRQGAEQENADPAEPAGTDIVPVDPGVASQPRRPIAGFVKEHPVLTVAGALAAGALVAALAPRRNRALVRKTAVNWADIVGTAAVTIAQQALDKAESTGEVIRRQSAETGDRAGALGHAAMRQVEKLSHRAAAMAAKVTPFEAEEPADLASRLSRKAERLKSRLRR